MEGFGEVIHGHYGQYITKQYGTASETEVKEFFLKNTETGDEDFCNYTIFFGTQKLPGYLWISYASAVGAQGSKAGYQHVIYQKCTLSGMHDGEKFLEFLFMSAEECMEYLGNQKAFTGESRSSLIKSFHVYKPRIGVDIPIDRELLGDIACYCVGKTRTNSKEFLKILVPSEIEDYQGYCLAMIRKIIGAIPCGLRTNLSFATNAPDMKYKFFGIVFKRDEGERENGYVRPDGDFDQTFLTDIYLPEPVKKIIRACAFDDSLAESCYRDMETPLYAEGKLNTEYYEDYYTLYKLQEEQFCLDYLRKLNNLFVSVESEWKRKQIENVLLERAENVRIVEETLLQSEEYKNAEELKEVLEILDSVGDILDYYREKGQNLSVEFGNQIVKKVFCWGSEKETKTSIEVLQEYAEELERFLGSRVKNVQSFLVKKYKEQIKSRLIHTVLQNPSMEVIQEVFEEAETFGDNFYKEFSGNISHAIMEAWKRKRITERELYELYFKLKPYAQTIEENYRTFAKNYTKAIYMKKIREIPSYNNVELFCRDMEEKFPEELERSLNDLVSNVLLPCYISMDMKAMEAYRIEETMVLLKKYSSDGRVNEKLEFRYRQYQIEKLKANLLQSPSAEDMQRLFTLVKQIMPKSLSNMKNYALKCVSRSFDYYRVNGTEPEKYPELFAYLCDIRYAVLKMIPDAEQRWPQDYMFFNGKYESCFNKNLIRYANLDFTPDRIHEVLALSKNLLNQRQFYKDLDIEIGKMFQAGKVTEEELTQIDCYMEEITGRKNALRFQEFDDQMEEDYKEEYEKDYYGNENENIRKSRAEAESRKEKRRQEVNRRMILLIAACAVVVVVGCTAAVMLNRKDKNAEPNEKETEVTAAPTYSDAEPNEKETEVTAAPADSDEEQNVKETEATGTPADSDEEQNVKETEVTGTPALSDVEQPVGTMSKEMATSIVNEAAELWISEESYMQAVMEFKSVNVLDLVNYMKEQESDEYQAQAVREYIAFSIMKDINEETLDEEHYEILNVDFYDVSGFYDMKPLTEECPAVLILTINNESGNKNKIYYYNKEENSFVDYGMNANGMEEDETELREKIKNDIDPIITTRTAHVQEAMDACEG